MSIRIRQGGVTATFAENTDLQFEHIPNPPPVNTAPQVAADAVLLADAGGAWRVDLNGTLLDDDRIPQPAQFLWRVLSPANSPDVTIIADDALNTEAVIAAPGVYLFELQASDGELVGSAQASITLRLPNQPPTVDAGLDRQVFVGDTVQLQATVMDEDPATVSVLWSSPDGVMFDDPASLSPVASFPPQAGNYTASVSATDAAGLMGSDSVSFAVSAVAPPPPPPGNLRIGAGLHQLAWYEDDAPFFLNRMREADGWTWSTSSGWGDGTPQPLTPDGYPASLAAGQNARTVITARPAEAARITWQGTGTVQIVGPGTVSLPESDRSIDIMFSGQGKDAGPHFIEISVTDPNDPVHNIRILPAGGGGDDELRPEMLSALGSYQCLRFMDWAMVNTAWWNDKVVTENPPTLPTRTYSDYYYGAPPEIMLQTAAQVGADAWVNLHDAITDNNARAYAQRLRSALAPGQVVYVELSNELWNFGFNQGGRYLQASQQQLGVQGESHRPYLAYRLGQIAKIFEDEFGADYGTRCKIVLAHIVDAEASDRQRFDAIYWREFMYMLNYPGEDGVLLKDRIHALASHGYVGLGALVGAGDLATVFGRMAANVQDLVQASTYFAAEARALGLEPCWYEWGQHLTWNSTSEEAMSRQAIEDPRMGDIYRSLIAGARAAGMGTICHFTGTGDFWGAQQNIFAPDGPRLLALRAGA